MLNMFPKKPSDISDRVLKKLVVVLESHSARSVGIAGLTAGVAANEIAEDLALMLAAFGRDTLLIRDEFDQESLGDGTIGGMLVEKLDRKLSRTTVPLSDLSPRTEMGDGSAPLARLISEHDVSILSLKPIYQSDGQLEEDVAFIAPYCDIAFLVAQTGTHLDSDLEAASAYCRSSKLKVVGLILNDRQLHLGGLISNC